MNRRSFVRALAATPAMYVAWRLPRPASWPVIPGYERLGQWVPLAMPLNLRMKGAALPAGWQYVNHASGATTIYCPGGLAIGRGEPPGPAHKGCVWIDAETGRGYQYAALADAYGLP